MKIIALAVLALLLVGIVDAAYPQEGDSVVILMASGHTFTGTILGTNETLINLKCIAISDPEGDVIVSYEEDGKMDGIELWLGMGSVVSIIRMEDIS